jgi:hypothetical protein
MRFASGAIDADGRFVVTGIQPGIRYDVTMTSKPSEDGDLSWYHLDGDGELAFPSEPRFATKDLTAVRASGLVARVHCPRLPNGAIYPENPTDDQRAASTASRLLVFDASGKLVKSVQPLLQRGIETVLPIATYRVRVEIAGAEPQEKTMTLDPSKGSTTVEFDIP